MKTNLRLVWNDILKEKADAIVTTASRNPRIGIGLDRMVHKAAGEKLEAARKKLGRIAPGRVAVSPSYNLAKLTGAKWVIHALGPVWSDKSGERDELVLDGCYLRILCKAIELKCRSVAMPVLSSGKFGMPMDRAVDVAVRAISDFLAAFPSLEVKLVGVDKDFHDYAKTKYPDLTVARITEEKAARYRKIVGKREDDATSTDDCFVIGDEDDVFGEFLLDQLAGDGTFKTMFSNLWLRTQRRERALRREAKKKRGGADEEDFIVNKSRLACKTGISENTIKHFCSSDGKSMRTSKDNIIALSVAMRLPLAYVARFLATCGYRLGTSVRDRFIRGFIEAGKGNVDALNTALASRGLDQLSSKTSTDIKNGS